MVGEFASIVTEKLSEENYDNWKECLKSYFIVNGLWNVVTGKEAKPEGGSEVYEEWVRKNAMALHAIQISCGGATMSKLRGNESAKFEWELLAEKIIVPLPHGKVEVKEQVTSTITEYRTLSKAVEEGDWEATRTFLEKKPEAISEKITLNGDTVLHVAVMAGQTEILKKLLASTGADLELKNDIGYTAFSIAAINGFKDMVEPMLERDENLVKLKDVHGLIPIVAASFYSSKEMVRYLYTKTPHEMLSPENTDRSGATLLNCLITDELYDVALHLLERYPSLGFVEDLHRNYAIRLLAHKRSAFPSGNRYVFCKQWIYSCMRVTSTQYEDEYPQSSDEESNIRIELKTNTQQVLLNKLRMLLWNLLTWIVPDIGHIYNRKSKHYEAQNFLKSIIKHIPYLSKEQLVKIGWDEAISDAIRNGITEFIDEVIESTPEIIWRKDKKGRTIFSHAIVQRQENIFSHIYGLGAKMRIAIIRHDIFHNNFLHLAAKLSPPSRLDRISGAALQMQRELEWFEEVSSILPPKYMEEVNENNKTPGELFTDEHQELMKQGESWMKNTAASCMVVATLIAAVMFTSAFTVPGGNDERRGTPIFLNRDAFLIFVISNAISLFASSTSVLVFLGILTSRYAEKDFRKSLPRKLIVGLFTLFFSIVTMMACFGAAIFLLLRERLHWIALPIIVLSSIPIALYSSFQFPLLIEILIYTYGGGIFDSERKRLYARSKVI